jgi:hypothetical protein
VISGTDNLANFKNWCSDAFEIGCDNGEKVRVALALDCCDREAISWVATTGGMKADGPAAGQLPGSTPLQNLELRWAARSSHPLTAICLFAERPRDRVDLAIADLHAAV